LGVGGFLAVLYTVPEYRPVMVMLRGVGREQNFRMNQPTLAAVVVPFARAVIIYFLSGNISGRLDG
jgi:hypothetical protein